MIKLIDYTKNNEEVTHFFIDLDNKNASYAYSNAEDMTNDIEATQSLNFKAGNIDKLDEWELTDE